MKDARRCVAGDRRNGGSPFNYPRARDALRIEKSFVYFRSDLLSHHFPSFLTQTFQKKAGLLLPPVFNATCIFLTSQTPPDALSDFTRLQRRGILWCHRRGAGSVTQRTWENSFPLVVPCNTLVVPSITCFNRSLEKSDVFLKKIVEGSNLHNSAPQRTSKEPCTDAKIMHSGLAIFNNCHIYISVTHVMQPSKTQPLLNVFPEELTRVSLGCLN